MSKPKKFTDLELEIDDLMSDGKKHSWNELYLLCSRYRDSQYDYNSFKKTIWRYKWKLKHLEPRSVVDNTTEGRKIFYRKYNLYVRS